MNKDPLVYLLAKRIDRWLLVPFCLTALLFVWSVCHHVYPGHSALLVSDAARLTPTLQQPHGLFSAITHLLAESQILTLPLRLNLFSAFCGCLSATLFFRLLARTLLVYCYNSQEDDALVCTKEKTEEKTSFNIVTINVELYNQRLLSIAIKSSLAATLLLAVMAPFWLATTHLNESIFNLALLLVILTIFPYEKSPFCHLHFLLAIILFTLGLFESSIFFAFLPVMASMSFAFYLGTESHALVLFHTLFGGFVGLMTAFYLCSLPPETVAAPFLLNLERFLKVIAYHHTNEVKLLFVTRGWLFVFIQTAIPTALLLFGKRLILNVRSGNAQRASLLILASAIPCVMNFSISPFAIYQQVDHLPVFSSAVLAATLAFVLAISLLFFEPKLSAEHANIDNLPLDELPPPPSAKPAYTFMVILLLIALFTPFRSLPYVKDEKSYFADAIAREMVTSMADRTWLITNGHLDSHLLIQAHLLKKTLHLVTLRQNENMNEHRELVKRVETDSTFTVLNRPRLLNALSIGTVRFVMEWFNSDTNIHNTVAVFATPELWTASKYRAQPQGLIFGGFREGSMIDTNSLLEASITLLKQLEPLLLQKDEKAAPVVARLSALLRLKMGFSVNELGTFLEAHNHSEEAFATYQRASQIHPDNVSAQLNAYALARGGNVKNSQVDALRQRLRKTLERYPTSRLGLQGVFRTHGTIHQKSFYQQEADSWITRGAPMIASEKIKKSLDLSQQTGVNALLERAYYYSIAEQPEEAQDCYLAAVEQDPGNFDALYGLTILMINKKDLPQAEAWLARAATSTSVNTMAVLYPRILIAIQRRDTAQTEKLLAEATQKYPREERFWKVRFIYLLNQGEFLLVRHEILPKMTKALKDPDHYLLHILRGLLLKQQGSAYYPEARIALLKGLSRNASMTETWPIVLELDMLIGNLGLLESDLKHLLIIDPDHVQANYMKGSIQLARGKIESAEDFMRRSIEKRPTAAACNDLAEILRRQKKLEEAKTFAHQAIELNPKLKNARATLASILADAENEPTKD